MRPRLKLGCTDGVEALAMAKRAWGFGSMNAAGLQTSWARSVADQPQSMTGRRPSGCPGSDLSDRSDVYRRSGHSVLDLLLGGLINVLLVVRNNALGNSLALAKYHGLQDLSLPAAARRSAQ